MSQLFICPAGHEWPANDGSPSNDSTCPVCGAPGETVRLDTHTQESGLDELPPPPRPLPEPDGDPLGRVAGYELLGELGRGGMAVVYKARQISLNRIVALKMLLSGMYAHPEEQFRFRTEAEAVARLQHPNIVHIYDIGEHEGRLYYSMEYLEGGTLAQKTAGQPVPPRAAAELTRTLARAVHAAHQRGIVHRDLKPANVLLQIADCGLRIEENQAQVSLQSAIRIPQSAILKIADFGLAKQLDEVGQTRTGAILGTPSYMAPEQAEGRVKDIGPRTDVYALGAILYELLTGRPPFRGPTSFHTLQQVIANRPDPPSKIQGQVPPGLESICLKCLQKDPAQRYDSAAQLADALDAFLTSPTTDRPGPARPKGRLAMLGLAGLAAMGLVALGVKFWPTAPTTGGQTSGLGTSPAVASEPGWESFVIADGEKFDRIAFPNRSVGFAASWQGLYRTGDGGQTWQSIHAGEIGRVFVLRFSDEKAGWLGTDRLQQTDDGGVSWKRVELPGDAMQFVSAFAESSGWRLAGGTSVKKELVLFRQESPGGPWTRLEPSGGYWGAGDSFRSWFLSDLAILGPRRAIAVVFHGYEEGGALLETTDGGASWKTLLHVPQDLFRLRFTDSQQGWLAGSRGGLWSTRDGGQSWQEQANPAGQSVTALAFAPTGGFGLAPVHQGQVLETRAGKPWRLMTIALGYSMPDAAVVDAGCAFVLGADGRIARYVTAPGR